MTANILPGNGTKQPPSQLSAHRLRTKAIHFAWNYKIFSLAHGYFQMVRVGTHTTNKHNFFFAVIFVHSFHSATDTHIYKRKTANSIHQQNSQIVFVSIQSKVACAEWKTLFFSPHNHIKHAYKTHRTVFWLLLLLRAKRNRQAENLMREHCE